MKLSQQPHEELHDYLLQVMGIGGLILLGVVMVFLRWLKYKQRNDHIETKPLQRPQRRAKKR